VIFVLVFTMTTTVLPADETVTLVRNDEGHLISPEFVLELEAQVIMPRDAQPLYFYDRYYARRTAGDGNLIEGVFLLRSGSFEDDYRYDRTPIRGVVGAFTIAILPIVMDGGCSVVNVLYDLRERDRALLDEHSDFKIWTRGYVTAQARQERDGFKVTVFCNGRA
jgi:hypothetical protein